MSQIITRSKRQDSCYDIYKGRDVLLRQYSCSNRYIGHIIVYCNILGGKKSTWELKIICMRIDSDIGRPITVAAHRLY